MYIACENHLARVHLELMQGPVGTSTSIRGSDIGIEFDFKHTLSFSCHVGCLCLILLKFRYSPTSLNQWNSHITCNYSNIQ